MPPDAVKVMLPLLLPQVASVTLPTLIVGGVVLVIVAVSVSEQPLASVTVTV